MLHCSIVLPIASSGSEKLGFFCKTGLLGKPALETAWRGPVVPASTFENNN
jgi:hypothetical protein